MKYPIFLGNKFWKSSVNQRFICCILCHFRSIIRITIPSCPKLSNGSSLSSLYWDYNCLYNLIYLFKCGLLSSCSHIEDFELYRPFYDVGTSLSHKGGFVGVLVSVSSSGAEHELFWANNALQIFEETFFLDLFSSRICTGFSNRVCSLYLLSFFLLTFMTIFHMIQAMLNFSFFKWVLKDSKLLLGLIPWFSLFHCFQN